MGLTDFLAVLGSVVGVIALLWNIVRDARDRGKLKLYVYLGRMYPGHVNKDYIVVSITNVGRRPLVVKNWGGMKRSSCPEPRGMHVMPIALPRMLKEGEYHIEYSEDLALGSPDTGEIYVEDSTGKKWKASRRNLKRLRDQVQRAGRENS